MQLMEKLAKEMVEMDAGCGNKTKGVARAWLRE